MSAANPFLYSETHLGRAGSLLLLEVLGGVSWAMLSRLESIHMLEHLATSGGDHLSRRYVDADGVVHEQIEKGR